MSVTKIRIAFSEDAVRVHMWKLRTSEEPRASLECAAQAPWLSNAHSPPRCCAPLVARTLSSHRWSFG
jgi:hypothetical protein